jgi:hypothetical protein
MSRFIWIMLFFLFNACAAVKNNDSQPIPSGAIEVTVIDYRELDGCTFLLEQQDKKKLQPVNLPAEFQKNGLRLYVNYKNVDGMGICMAGTMVELTFMKEVK